MRPPILDFSRNDAFLSTLSPLRRSRQIVNPGCVNRLLLSSVFPCNDATLLSLSLSLGHRPSFHPSSLTDWRDLIMREHSRASLLSLSLLYSNLCPFAVILSNRSVWWKGGSLTQIGSSIGIRCKNFDKCPDQFLN